jgi:hypothetical protein
VASPLSPKHVIVGTLCVGMGAVTTWKALDVGLLVQRYGVAPLAPNAEGDADGSPPEASSATRFATYGGPRVLKYPAPDGGRHTTIVQFQKNDGPWDAGHAWTFDVWFDGAVDSEFEGRGFEDPIDYGVTFPEPSHVTITVRSAPIEAAQYVAFVFKSARPVSVTRIAVAPRDTSGADALPPGWPSRNSAPVDEP